MILALLLGMNLLFPTAFGKNNTHIISHDLPAIKEHLKKDLTPMVPGGAGGIVGIVKPGEKPEFVTLGKVSVDSNIPVNKDTLSLVASTSKMFVGLLSARLLELGILSLDTELSQMMEETYFQIFEDKELAKHITLRQMLSHTSGLQYDTDCDRNERAGQDLDTILKNMSIEAQLDPSKQIRFTNNPKDKIFSYSNQIWIATIFIEQAYNRFLQSKDGMKHHLSYADILDREIIKPLDMTRTGFQKSEDDPFANDKNKMQAYVEKQGDKPAYSYEIKTLDPVHRAVGGLWTTPADLMKLASSLTRNGLVTKTGKVLISKSYIDQLIKPQGINGNVGLGVYHEHDRVGKGGSLSSYGSNFEIDFATGNAVVSLINFRPAVPVKFDSRALLALDEMGSTPRPEKNLSDEIKNNLRAIKKQYEKSGMEIYDDIYVSKFGYIGVKAVSDGLIMNWNGNTITAGKIETDRFMIFDDEYRDGTEVLFGVGPDSQMPYLFFENGNDNSQAFKATTKDEAIPKDIPDAFKIIKDIHGTKGKTYKGTRPDGAGSITIKVDDEQNKVIAQDEGKAVPVLITKIVRNNDGQIVEIWFMGNHFVVPDKLTKLIKKDNIWVLAIAIFDNPENNVEYLSAVS